MSRYKVSINGKTFQVVVEDMGEDQDTGGTKVPRVLKNKPASTDTKTGGGMGSPEGAEGIQVVAPLSGSIFSLSVSSGEDVTKGQVLLTLEALKMENEILSPESGTVMNIMVNTGDAVNTGDVLMIIKGTQGV